jgi:hypothetical protein
MNTLKKISSLLSALMILATLIPTGLAQSNLAFYIYSAVYDESNEVINVFWSNNTNIQEATEYSISYEVFSHSAGIFESSEPDVFLAKDSFQYTINPTVKNKQYNISMRAYNDQGSIINEDSIVVFTDFAFSNTTYEYFMIDGARYDTQNSGISIDWTTYSNPSDVAIDYYEITINPFDINTQRSDASFTDTLFAPMSFHDFPALANKEYYISITAYATDGTIIGTEDIDVDSTTSNTNPIPQNYQGFGILAADYNDFSQRLGVFWEETNLSSNTIPIDRFVFNYNVHDLNSGNFEYSFQEESFDVFTGDYYINAETNKEYFISMEAFAFDGTFIGSDDITVDTFSNNNSNNIPNNNNNFPPPPYVEPDFPDFPDFNNTYFINSVGYGAGQVDVQWDPNTFSGIQNYDLFYDVYDFGGNYVFGSQVINLPGNSSSHTFREQYNIDNGEILVSVSAYDDFGFVGSDQLSIFTGEGPSDNGNFGYYPKIDISHSFGRYSVVDLFVGDEITFYAETDSSVNTLDWMQTPNKLLNCRPASNNREYKCTAQQTGDTDIYFLASGSTGEEFPSLPILVYVNDSFNLPSVCPVHPEPPCPNGNIYYPPAADGCLGKPVCKTQGGNIPVPTAGYEDEVTNVYASQQNPFKDVKAADLAGKAAIELFYRGVLGGFPDGEFKGDRPVNRAEASKFLLLAKGLKILSIVRNNPFSDIPLGEWYTDFVLEAAIQEIIKGHPDGTFKAADGVLTSEFIAMLARTFDLPTGLPHEYKDEAKYKGAWFWEYAGIAKKYQLFPDRKDTLQPERPLTRKEVAIAIYQYLRNR